MLDYALAVEGTGSGFAQAFSVVVQGLSMDIAAASLPPGLCNGMGFSGWNAADSFMRMRALCSVGMHPRRVVCMNRNLCGMDKYHIMTGWPCV